jgi:(E)-4-hydroxy-3-methylbut-2-enyl-diphosphate synthase
VDQCIDVAIMGCEVNGPGEAKEADLGIAFGKDKALLFIKGDVKKTGIPKELAKDLLIEEIHNLS